jgi:hypothetical protein
MAKAIVSLAIQTAEEEAKKDAEPKKQVPRD